jgi:hypothetical protein
MDPRIAAPFVLLKLNTRLFLNALEGVDDAAAQLRPSDETNSMIFIACHLLDARGFLAGLVGIEYRHPYKEIFDAADSFAELRELPPLEGLRTAWRDVSSLLAERFPALSDDELRRESTLKFPVEDTSVLGVIAFLLGHESFHIGQLAILRKYYGLGSMSY